MKSNHESGQTGEPVRLTRRLTPLGIWALSFGCSVGWGAFVMPGTTFLPIGGPLGTVLGIAFGAAIMLIISVNYSFLMNRYPDAGGTFTFAKSQFGYDHGFLSSWFMMLVYLAIIWANATAIPLIFRGVFGNLLMFGRLYSIAGYDVYVGEILVSLAAILLCGFVCMRGIRRISGFQIVLALLLIGGIVFAFVASSLSTDSPGISSDLTPLFAEDKHPALGVLFIVFLAPWAFAGFESVSHTSEECKKPPKRILRVFIVSLMTSAAAYILLALLASFARPEGFSSWTDYVSILGDQSGIRSLPTFQAVSSVLGGPGVAVLFAAAVAGILTGLIGNMTAGSRLLFAVSRDNLIPSKLSALNKNGSPVFAVLLLTLISLPIPFFGRAAIGWIIDVNTIGIAIVYAYTSASAFRAARKERKKPVMATGIVGIAVSLFFLFYFLAPLGGATALATESYLILVLWAVLGFVCFYFMFRKDRGQRIGHSTLIWIVLLLLIVVTSTIWVIGTTQQAVGKSVSDLVKIYVQNEPADAVRQALESGFSSVTGIVIRNTIIQFALLLVSVIIIFVTYANIRKRHQTAEAEKVAAESTSQAKTTFLSNMSHDIRTPMNAIVGYVTLARREPSLSPKTAEYLDKIDSSSAHLLSLINDVLEMSRIESGRMELMPVPTDLRDLMREVKNLFGTQMESKKLQYEVRCENLRDPHVLCDRNRMNRVLLNLISNAYKFTPEGGSVTVDLRQLSREGNRASYELKVRDTGIGMSPEFAAKVFEAYERERTSTVENIQGTGLGTAITKNIVDLMGGHIGVESEKGKGSCFTVSFPLDLDLDAEAKQANEEAAAHTRTGIRGAGLKLLIVDDDQVSLDLEKTLFEEAGFTVETASDGEEAAEAVASGGAGAYDCVLMDIEMPVKNGYAAARLIRSLKDEKLANVPIVALTAKAFSEDVTAAREAGMNGHIAKPLNMKNALETLSGILRFDLG